jgi:hypothetical protein
MRSGRLPGAERVAHRPGHPRSLQSPQGRFKGSLRARSWIELLFGLFLDGCGKALAFVRGLSHLGAGSSCRGILRRRDPHQGQPSLGAMHLPCMEAPFPTLTPRTDSCRCWQGMIRNPSAVAVEDRSRPLPMHMHALVGQSQFRAGYPPGNRERADWISRQYTKGPWRCARCSKESREAAVRPSSDPRSCLMVFQLRAVHLVSCRPGGTAAAVLVAQRRESRYVAPGESCTIGRAAVICTVQAGRNGGGHWNEWFEAGSRPCACPSASHWNAIIFFSAPQG